jgi:hypothetical protein
VLIEILAQLIKQQQEQEELDNSLEKVLEVELSKVSQGKVDLEIKIKLDN